MADRHYGAAEIVSEVEDWLNQEKRGMGTGSCQLPSTLIVPAGHEVRNDPTPQRTTVALSIAKGGEILFRHYLTLTWI